MDTKRCTKCKETKSRDSFSPDKRHSDGLYSRCKQCMYNYKMEKRRNDSKVRDAENEHKRNRYANEPDYRNTIRESQRQKYAENEEFRESIKANNREYSKERYANDPDYRKSIREYRRNWRNTIEGSIRTRLSTSKRRDRIRETDDGTVTAAALARLLDEQDYICCYCPATLTMEFGTHQAWIEHRESLANGGKHTITNIAWSCRTCNLSKADRNETEWINHQT